MGELVFTQAPNECKCIKRLMKGQADLNNKTLWIKCLQKQQAGSMIVSM